MSAVDIRRVKHDTSLSVVIPSLGRPRVLCSTLHGLSQQASVPLEVVVVAQDEITLETTRRLASELPLSLSVKYLEEPNASAARNVGLVASRGDIVLFLDDDVRIDNRRFFEAHLDNYEDPQIPGVIGQMLPRSGEERHNRHPRSRRPRVGWLYFPYNYTQRCKVYDAPTGNFSVRRRWALEIGGMDEQYEKGAHREDSDFCLRLTARYGPLVFDPTASLVHLGEEEGGCRSWGTNRGVHPMHHVTGEWYFILKNLRAGRILLRDLPDHLFVLARRQILNRRNVRRPWRVFRALLRSVRGFAAALGKLREGPRYLSDSTAAGRGSKKNPAAGGSDG